jgi:hypothetical protein
MLSKSCIFVAKPRTCRYTWVCGCRIGQKQISSYHTFLVDMRVLRRRSAFLLGGKAAHTSLFLSRCRRRASITGIGVGGIAAPPGVPSAQPNPNHTQLTRHCVEDGSREHRMTSSTATRIAGRSGSYSNPMRCTISANETDRGWLRVTPAGRRTSLCVGFNGARAILTPRTRG